MKPVNIVTERFVLRPLVEKDATEVYSRWFDDPEVALHINAARSPHDVAALRQNIASKAADPTVLFLGIFMRRELQHIGNLKFEPINHKKRTAILGIMIGAREWRGRGVAAEVLIATADWLHRELGIVEIALGVTHENVSAQRAYEKAGFVFDSLEYLSFSKSYARTMVKRIGAGTVSNG